MLLEYEEIAFCCGLFSAVDYYTFEDKVCVIESKKTAVCVVDNKEACHSEKQQCGSLICLKYFLVTGTIS